MQDIPPDDDPRVVVDFWAPGVEVLVDAKQGTSAGIVNAYGCIISLQSGTSFGKSSVPALDGILAK